MMVPCTLRADSCDGVTPTAAVITEVVDATSESEPQVMRWLADCLRQLAELGVIEPSPI